MRQKRSIFIPILALTFLVSCNNGGDIPTPPGPKPDPSVTYTVTFDSKEGSYTPDSQTIEAGKPATEPTEPVKQDFIFGGWYTDEAATEYQYDFARPVVTDLTLYAKWKPVDALVTVTFDAGDGKFANGKSTFPIKVDRNSELNLCLNIMHSYGDPTSDGNTFAYYDYKDTNKGISYNDIVTSDVTIAANYFPTKDVPYEDLNDLSWDVIKKIAVTNTKSHISDLFKIGATKDIYFDYSGTKVKHTVQLLSFSADRLHYDEGERTTLSPEYAGITFDFSTLISDKNGKAITTKWDDSSSNKDFENSTFNKLLNKDNNCIFNRLPDDLKGIIEEVDQKVARGDKYYVEPRYTTKLYPLAYSEMVKDSVEGAADEGAIYGFYGDGGETVRKKKDSKGNESVYWLRSPYTIDDMYGVFDKAWAINASGEPFNSNIGTGFAFAPAFCI